MSKTWPLIGDVVGPETFLIDPCIYGDVLNVYQKFVQKYLVHYNFLLYL